MKSIYSVAIKIAFIDSEIGENGSIDDLGAIRSDGAVFHSKSTKDFTDFVSNCEFLCGHNIVAHDMRYLGRYFPSHIPSVIDTLPLSPLLFPKKEYHKLVKDDKLQTEELNNPLNDSIKAKELFYDEVNAFHSLPCELRQIYCNLLYHSPLFKGFFDYYGISPTDSSASLIGTFFCGMICSHTNIEALIKNYPIELAYALAITSTHDRCSITPPWVMFQYPKVENVMRYLRNTPCKEGCAYCNSKLNGQLALKNYFGFDHFRSYDGNPLQESAVNAAIGGKSLLAIFPTGGGKSLTFQLPALISGESVHGLTVVISPLQSLMKDQVDNLENRGIVGAVTVNGLLSPIERAKSLQMVENGMASLLYISPEQLRSHTIKRLLMKRNVVRFVIDEAHCFSAWGQDFRVDYLYIGDFIRELQESKSIAANKNQAIPVSCFTATAKKKVISDIVDYFKRKLDLDLELYATNSTRKNLSYHVLFCDSDVQKYTMLRNLIEKKNCPTIVYVSRTRRCMELAKKLTADGFLSKPFNGKMDSNDKVANQEAFMDNRVKVIVATSAFGMGVDKKDVGLVIHYDISDSLENYIQEAGRAGRDESLQAECYVLYNDADLDKHFILLNQTKLSISEIQQVWKAVRDLTKSRPYFCSSPLEIARQAGWDTSTNEIETRIRAAISALETAGYVKRGKNVPQIYATGILVDNMTEAVNAIAGSKLFADDTAQSNAKRIIKSLISSRSRANAGNDDAESRIDYLADMLGITKENVVNTVNNLRQAKILADTQDMSAFVHYSDIRNRSTITLDQFAKLERFLWNQLSNEVCLFHTKDLNDKAIDSSIPKASVKNIKTIFYFWSIKGYVHKEEDGRTQQVRIAPLVDRDELVGKFEGRIELCKYILNTLFKLAEGSSPNAKNDVAVSFSLVGLWENYIATRQVSFTNQRLTREDMEDALLYLSKIGAISLEGGFMVLYNRIEIKRLKDSRLRYKVEDYKLLDEFYQQRIQQIHIVGEFANLMVRDYDEALGFVSDYFQMDYRQFVAKYFKGERVRDINRNITPQKYHELFSTLSSTQLSIIQDNSSKYIVVSAGPGSGKTKVLVHKLASLLLLEDVKHEQLLMLTFSRAAATEFKHRLMELIGNAAMFVEIKTFHSYCFDLLGKLGNLEDAQNIVADAAAMIANGEVELGQITKSVVVIDEAQDMDENEYHLIEALMQRNEEMRVIAVGDDDQNIYEFRGSDSKHFASFVTEHHATRYEMLDNYRSRSNIIALANSFVTTISNRMKTDPIRAVNESLGKVQITRHNVANMEQAVVDGILTHNLEGSTCVLTTTNDEALRVVGLLSHKGIPSTLIQSNEGFSLINLAEIRFFVKYIGRQRQTPLIHDEVWCEAKARMKELYADSTCLNYCLNLIQSFESVNKVKYYTDFIEFVRESRYEDFFNDRGNSIVVSTIHKSKGHEFDNVYIMLGSQREYDDGALRSVYVGLTRAKSNLFIHCNNNLFNRTAVPHVDYFEDPTCYEQPSELTFQLSHKDVYLDYFKGKKDKILKLRSGQDLVVDNDGMSVEVDGNMMEVLLFSKKFVEDKVTLKLKGYHPTRAVVRFVVAWKGENDSQETAIILPNVTFTKN